MTNIKKIETTETARALQSSENESSLHEEEQPTFYRLLRRCLNRNPDYQALLLLAATPWSAGLVFLTLLVPSLLVFRSTSLGFALLMTVAGLVSTGVFFLARAAVSSIQSLRERQEALDCQYQMQIKVLSHFPETNPNPVIRLGRDSRILYLNPAAEKLLESTGLDRASAREILPADMENLFDTASYEESSSFERVVTVRGKTIQYHCTAHPDEQTIILSGNDVSYLKEIENHLRHLNRNLEKYVIKRSEELNRIQDVTILCLAGLTETRDAETGEHIERTRNYVRL
ncbi:MAG: hypothetical protein U9N45_03335, partial [Gemmatimonadota bacterium]|nr:hypothetical protein [Gemmatimonadota bacterium]